VEIKGVKLGLGYEGRMVLQDFDIEIRQGEITTFVGPNGSGKSTVLKTLTRLLPCRQGTVLCNGTPLPQIASRAFAQKVGILPQQHLAPPDFSVWQLVSFGRVPYQDWHSGNSPEDDAVVEWAMEATGVKKLRDKRISDCSGGEAQRVWIAAVLAQQPDLLFLDEPTTFLDISYQYEVMQLVKKLNRENGLGIIMVLHDLGQALEVSDRVVVIKDGKKYAEGPPEAVITSRMLREVYQVDCDVVRLPGRKRPILAYREIS
jgi:iron complex transport system ATP-binding protein